MADTFVDKTAIVVEIEDNTAPGAAKVEKSVENMAKKTASTTKTMVGEQAGKALSQFNEKTEKGRQLLNLMGGAIGSVAGSAVYFGGTIAYVIGRFKIWELATMGLAGALFGLGAALQEHFTAPMREANEEAKKLLDTTNRLLDATDRYVLSVLDARDGTTAYQKKVRDLKSAQTDLNSELDRMKEALGYDVKEAKGLVELGVLGDDAKTLIGNINKTEVALALVNAQIDKLKRMEIQEAGGAVGGMLGWLGMAGGVKQKGVKAKTQKKGAAKKSRGWNEEDMDQVVEWYLELEEAKRRHNERMINLEWQLDDQLWSRALENEARRQMFADRELEAERKKHEELKKMAEERLEQQNTGLDVAQSVAESYIMIASSVLKSEKAKMRAEAILQAITDGIKAAHETAEAVAAYARYDYWSGTQHAAAATLYSVSASLAAAKAGGAFSAGYGGMPGGMSAGPDMGGRRDDSQRQVVVYINGPILGNAGAGDFIKDALSAAEDRDNPGRTRTEVD